jgi:RimJ/RimL family protein N-acetyltransferase
VSLTTRALAPADREQLDRLLERGGAADVFLREQLASGGIADYFGAFEDTTLVGATILRRGAICAASLTPRPVAAALAYPMAARGPWGSVVGPEPPCDAIVEVLGGREVLRVDRTQGFYVIRRGDHVGEGEPALRLATAGDLDQLVPIVHRYRIEDGLARRADSISQWIRDHTADRIDSGHVYVAEDQGRIVFTGAFNFRGPFGAGLGGIYTLPEMRGRGLAQRATADLARIGLAEGPFVTLHVDPANAPAIRAYQAAGFRAAGRFRLTFR